MNREIISAAKILWNYHLMGHHIEKADCLLALGSHDLRVAERTAELYLNGYAPLVIMSGGLGNFTKNLWTEKEADKFARRAIQMGVPKEAILIENQSTNTGENIQFVKKLLIENNLPVKNLILIQKPYMERRSYATICKQWPEMRVMVTSPLVSFEAYPNEKIPLERVINIMVGDLQRIKEYPKSGFQITQQIPDKVQEAYDTLILNGFDQHLIR